jgi:hypothetical protein
LRCHRRWNFKVQAETDCKNVREFFDKLGTPSLSDLTNKKERKVWQCFNDSRMSPNCLVPAAVLDAAWMEAGLLSKTRAQACGSKSIEYIND